MKSGSTGVVQMDNVAEWSKAVDSGSIPKGRGFEPLRCHFCDFGEKEGWGWAGDGEGRDMGGEILGGGEFGRRIGESFLGSLLFWRL